VNAAQLTLFPLPRALGDTRCLDCDLDTLELGECYIVRDEVWDSVCEPNGGMLCIGCLEGRLGRRLESSDFKDVPVNHSGRCSERLRARMFRWKEGEAMSDLEKQPARDAATDRRRRRA
jgi:hypothetical protein